jgi:hypothetical protein
MFERRRRCIFERGYLHVDKKSNGQGCAILGEGLNNLVSGGVGRSIGLVAMGQPRGLPCRLG